MFVVLWNSGSHVCSPSRPTLELNVIYVNPSLWLNQRNERIELWFCCKCCKWTADNQKQNCEKCLFKCALKWWKFVININERNLNWLWPLIGWFLHLLPGRFNREWELYRCCTWFFLFYFSNQLLFPVQWKPLQYTVFADAMQMMSQYDNGTIAEAKRMLWNLIFAALGSNRIHVPLYSISVTPNQGNPSWYSLINFSFILDDVKKKKKQKV